MLSDLPKLKQADLQSGIAIQNFLKNCEEIFDNALANGIGIRQIVQCRSQIVDELLGALFDFYELNQTDMVLFATGGYGRGELHPHSDVDILLLNDGEIDDVLNQKISPFLANLWDIGIEPAIVVRSVEECDVACQDITVATGLLEARYLAGQARLAKLPLQLLAKNWTQAGFYWAKMHEAKQRYYKHNATEYNLEPDIKNAPGGLRDIHMIGWVWKQYVRVNRLYDLVQQNFITEKEFDEIQLAEDFLWQVRHHLHRMTMRNENRLLFDYQRSIAKKMGYTQTTTDSKNAGVERFMRDYYRFAMSNANLSEMLTQHYYEVVIETALPDDEKPVHKLINERFKLVGNQIAVVHNKVFAQSPWAILELFLLMGQMNIKHIRTRTLRVLAIASLGIDKHFRQNPLHQQLFMANLKEQNLLFWRLRVMKRYGVLGRYLPKFGWIVGLMQYDLFHRYTVDAHILLLVRMLHRFTDDNYEKSLPLVSGIYRRIKRKELLIIAAIFHDIAKGRGGDHSALGEQDAIEFCLTHGLSQADADLVGWLVGQHLLMSLTAQKKDISDPAVVADFAEKVGNVTYLNHLYVLTVADMNATNPQLWNSWRSSLMRQLYTQTRRILRADIDAPMNRQDMIANNQQIAKNLLANDTQLSSGDIAQIESLWQELGDEYFLREMPSDIVWHSKAIVHHENSALAQNPLIILREHRELALDAVQVFIYTQDVSNLFAVTMSVFDRMNLDVLDARIITASRDFALDSYVLLDRHGTILTDTLRQQDLVNCLNKAFKNPNAPSVIKKVLPRELKYFNVPTKVSFEFNPETKQHMMILEALDQPALLARVGQVFLQHDIEVHFARITTLGERAEDMFLISNRTDTALDDTVLEKLKQDLITVLSVNT
ncbi:uridylyltransferase [Moraxella macacae 0408225]|uniref:Bifunctional uridylyltransferase/uridylyl-removing enzyme n=1 Tax=Moraxella macacae 0408225 TaxID=1230338 RepID=L2F8L3_9GAMM|nr:[protein-PII] uridylyltransferase [Moraxella macacae]ELA09076.1 uridylyltransferase [Moraxella macacae 0408225]